MKSIISIAIIALAMISSAAGPAAYAAEDEESSSAVTAEVSGENGADQDEDTPSPAPAPLERAAQGESSQGSVGAGAPLSPLLTESFQTDLATGSATANIPIVVPPGRKNMQPNLALSYSSNNPNGVCGVGWGLTTSSIQRSTKKGIPRYDSTDTFVFASSGSSGDLVLVDGPGGEYRQRIETGFMKYVFDGTGSKWTVWDRTGTKYIFGSSLASRIMNSDETKTFAWFLDRVEDVYGNTVLFTYEKDGGQIYLKEVQYTVGVGLGADKSIIFNYLNNRADNLCNNRSGWEITTKRLLSSIYIYVVGDLEWRYVLSYSLSADTGRSLLDSLTVYNKENESLPPKRFLYQRVN